LVALSEILRSFPAADVEGIERVLKQLVARGTWSAQMIA
jgi:hypothetical protein